MDAMFDRMDAIGKGIPRPDDPMRPVPRPQVRSAHAARILPPLRVSQQRRRSQHHRLHARGAAATRRCSAPRSRSGRRIEASDARLAAAHGRVGSASQSRSDRNGRCCGRKSSGNRPAAKSTSAAARWLVSGLGYAPTKHTVHIKVNTDVKNVTAFRLELLNDPNLPRGGPGRSIQGTAALTEFSVEPRQRRQGREAQIRQGHGRLQSARTPLDAIYDDRSKKHRVIGPVSIRHRRQG